MLVHVPHAHNLLCYVTHIRLILFPLIPEIISFAVIDEAALETETRITPLINEKKRLFNDLLTLKGTVLSSVLPDLHPTHLLLMESFLALH